MLGNEVLITIEANKFRLCLRRGVVYRVVNLRVEVAIRQCLARLART